MGGERLFFKPAKYSPSQSEQQLGSAHAIAGVSFPRGEGSNMNPLNNHRQSLILGIVLALVLALAIAASRGIAFNPQSFARWLHIVAGVFWIGLLYYFNAVQVPA